MCKGQKSTTTTSTYNPAASGYYSDILNRAQDVAATPYQAYSGELVAPINAQQNLGIGNVNQYAGFGLPYYQQAGDLITEASKPISSADISQYMNPYTQNVVDKTLAAYDLYNKQQQNNVVGNAAAQHALGGNRVGTAQANLAALQSTTQAPQIAKLYSDAYTSGLGTALSQQQNKLAAAYGLGSIGGGGQGTALAGANAQIGAGNLQQGTQQALDTARYNQFLQERAYPFQTAQWQAGITGALGPSMGGTQTGVTTQPQPSLFSQIAGLGMAGLGAASGLGWRPFAASGGRINGYADGGMPDSGMSAMPYAGGKSWIPTISLQPGRVPSLQTPQTPQYPDEAQNMMRSGLSMMGRGSGASSSGVGAVDFDPADTFVYDMPEEAGMFSGLGDSIGGALGSIGEGISGGLGSIAEFLPFLALKNGGGVRGYQDAGGVPFDDRFGDLTPSVDMTDQGVDPRNLGAILRHAEGLNSYNLMPNEQTPLVSRPVSTERYAFDDNVPLPRPQPQVAGIGSLPSLITRGTSNPNVQLDDEGIGALGYDEAPRTAGMAPIISPAYSPSYRQEVPAGRGFLGLSGVPNDEASMALIATGLGMAASRSPYPLAALGEGGLQGLQTLRQLRSDKLAAQRLDEMARQHLDRMNLDRARLLQTEKYQGEMTDIARKRLDLGNYTIDPNRETADGHPIGVDHKTGNLVDLVTKKPIGEGAELKNLKNVWKPLPNKVAEDGSPIFTNGQGQMMNATTKEMLGPGSKVLDAKTVPLDDRDRRARGQQLALGDLKSAYGGMGYGQAAAQNKNAVYHEAMKILVDEGHMSVDEAARYLSSQSQAFNATGIGMNAEARTAATREAGLRIILNATNAAIPAAIELSDQIGRTRWTPINRIIQEGRVIASDPTMIRFGIANLQLAEHWAKAMNPTGVMRNEDRDLALRFLNTATGPEGYKAAVTQLKLQIEREEAAVHSFLQKNGDTAMGKADALTYESVKRDLEKTIAANRERAGPTAPGATRSPQDQQALDWANAHPNDPRAAQIKQKLGVQ